jgi:hypothetical protein
MLLCTDVVEQILSWFEGCREDLCVVNTLKAVNRQWLQAARCFLQKHAGSTGMLELFRHDCVHALGGLQLPMHCRLSPYASTRGLTVLSTLDDFGVLERSVPAVLLELCVGTEACCPYSMWEPACSIREEMWHDDECPCLWHFEEVLEGIYDPAFCLAKLEIQSVRLEVRGAIYTSIYEAMRTEFEDEEIDGAVEASACSQQSVLLSCVHVGCEFKGRWLSLSILRVLSKLLNENSRWCLRL